MFTNERLFTITRVHCIISCDALSFGDKKMQKFLHKLKNNDTVFSCFGSGCVGGTRGKKEVILGLLNLIATVEKYATKLIPKSS